MNKFRANVNWYISYFNNEQKYLKLLNERDSIPHNLYRLQSLEHNINKLQYLVGVYLYYLVQNFSKKEI